MRIFISFVWHLVVQVHNHQISTHTALLLQFRSSDELGKMNILEIDLECLLLKLYVKRMLQ